jgi:hypothetical protein
VQRGKTGFTQVFDTPTKLPQGIDQYAYGALSHPPGAREYYFPAFRSGEVRGQKTHGRTGVMEIDRTSRFLHSTQHVSGIV